jgi:hypothetical protein
LTFGGDKRAENHANNDVTHRAKDHAYGAEAVQRLMKDAPQGVAWRCEGAPHEKWELRCVPCDRTFSTEARAATHLQNVHAAPAVAPAAGSNLSARDLPEPVRKVLASWLASNPQCAPRKFTERIDHAKLYKKARGNAHLQTIGGCAVCGTYALIDKPLDIKLETVADVDADVGDDADVLVGDLLANLDRRKRAQTVERLLVDKEWHKKFDPDGKKVLHTMMFKERLWHVNEEFVDAATGKASVCATCHQQLEKQSLPKHCFRSGWDFGSHERLHAEVGLPKLTALEKIAISRTVFFCTAMSVYIKPPTPHYHGERLAGHAVCFATNTVEEFAKSLPRRDAFKSVVVVFLGPYKQWVSTFREEFIARNQIRPEVVGKWLKFLKANHDGYKDVDVDEDALARLATLPTELANEVVVSELEELAELARRGGADVSNLGQTVPPAEAPPPPVDPAEDGARNKPVVPMELEQVLVTVPGDVGSSNLTLEATLDLLRQAEKKKSRPAAAPPDDAAAAPPDADAGAAPPDAAAAPAAPAAPPPPHPNVVGADVEKTAVNEFTQNEELFTSGMPYLFPAFRKTSPAKIITRIDQNVARMLLFRRGCSYANDSLFNFVVYNQGVRHRVAARNASLRSCPKVMKLVEKWSTDIPATIAALKKAQANPDTPDAKRLINEINYAIVLSTGGIPFTPAARRSARKHFQALTMWAGLPMSYITINPADMDLRMGQMMVGAMKDPAVDPMPPYFDRLVKMTGMPAASATCFYRLMRVIANDLIGLPFTHDEYRCSFDARSTPCGIFGPAGAFYMVTEAQARGRLHGHGLVWPGYDRNELFYALYAGDPEFRAHFDAMYCHRKPANTADDGEDPPAALEEDAKKQQVRPTARMPPAAYDADGEWSTFMENIIRVVQMHAKCGDVCRKGGRGATLCRFAMPAPAVEQTGVFRFVVDKETKTVSLQAFERYPSLAELLSEHQLPAAASGGQHVAVIELVLPEPAEADADAAVAVRAPSPAPDAADAAVVLGDPPAGGSPAPAPRPDAEDASQPAAPAAAAPAAPAAPLPFFFPYHYAPDPRATGIVCKRGADEGNVVGYNPLLSSIACCNTAIVPLGAAIQAEAAMFYLIKYMTKHIGPLTHSAAAIAAALNRYRSQPSRAPDAHTDGRKRQTILNRIACAHLGAMEISPQMAAAFNLGYPSEMSSHGFAYLDAPGIVQCLKDETKKAAKPQGAAAAHEDQVNEDERFEWDSSGDDGGAFGDDDPDLLDAEGAAWIEGRVQGAAAQISTAGSRLVKLSLPKCYLHRGPSLRALSFVEYVALVKVEVKKRQAQQPAGNDSAPRAPTAGRPRNETYEFDPEFDLAADYVQVLRSKFFVPVFLGPRVPRPVTIYDVYDPLSKTPLEPKASATSRSQIEHARYMTALFRPWTAEDVAKHGSNFCSPSSYSAYLEDLHRRAERQIPANDEVALIDRDHAIVIERYVNNTALLLRSSHESRVLYGTWRFQLARRFNLGANASVAEKADKALDDLMGAVMGLDRDAVQYLDGQAVAIDDALRDGGGGQAPLVAADAPARNIVNRYSANACKRMHDELAAGSAAVPDGSDVDGGDDFNGETAAEQKEREARERAAALAAGAIAIEAFAAAPSPEVARMDVRQRLFYDTVMGAVQKSWRGDFEADDDEQARLFLLLGGPGTGKTFVCNAIADAIGRGAQHGAGGILRCATTGVAATLIGGQTFHSALNIHLGHSTQNDQQYPTEGLLKNKRRWLRSFSTIMIDECSMMGQRALALIQHRLTLRGPGSFGGIIVVLCGDFFQLSPVQDTALYHLVLKGRRAVAPTAVAGSGGGEDGAAAAAAETAAAGPEAAAPAPAEAAGPEAAAPAPAAAAPAQAPAQKKAPTKPTKPPKTTPYDFYDGNQNWNIGQFQRFDLDVQHRVNVTTTADAEHCERLAKMRASVGLRRQALYQIAENPKYVAGWPAGAMLLVSSNAERLKANERLAIRDARTRGLPVYSFSLKMNSRRQPRGKTAEQRAAELQQELIAELQEEMMSDFVPRGGDGERRLPSPAAAAGEGFDEHLRFYFVQGAPGIITKNIAVAKGIANGTRCVLESFTLSDDNRRKFNATMAAADLAPGAVVSFDFSPEYIVVSTTVRSNMRTESVQVPLPRGSSEKDDSAKKKAGPKHHSFQLELGYACTFHKVQGMSLDNVVLDVNRRPKQLGNLDFAGLYVGLSRVKSAEGLFFMPPRNVARNLMHITELKPPPALLEWCKSTPVVGAPLGSEDAAAAAPPEQEAPPQPQPQLPAQPRARQPRRQPAPAATADAAQPQPPAQPRARQPRRQPVAAAPPPGAAPFPERCRLGLRNIDASSGCLSAAMAIMWVHRVHLGETREYIFQHALRSDFKNISLEESRRMWAFVKEDSEASNFFGDGGVPLPPVPLDVFETLSSVFRSLLWRCTGGEEAVTSHKPRILFGPPGPDGLSAGARVAYDSPRSEVLQGGRAGVGWALAEQMFAFPRRPAVQTTLSLIARDGVENSPPNAGSTRWDVLGVIERVDGDRFVAHVRRNGLWIRFDDLDEGAPTFSVMDRALVPVGLFVRPPAPPPSPERRQRDDDDE